MPALDPNDATTHTPSGVSSPAAAGQGAGNNNAYGNNPTQQPTDVAPPGGGSFLPGGASLASTLSSSGLFVGVACFGAILLSTTAVAPIAFGLLSVGLIFQLRNLLQGT